MTTVQQAETIINSEAKDFGTETIYFEQALGRVLAEDLLADRDLPPCDRVTMDGIAINFEIFEQGIRTFTIKAIQAAGDAPQVINQPDECIEIMTGAALPAGTDTVVRYEDLEIKDGKATIIINQLVKGQSIHHQGKDKLRGEIVAPANQLITPALIHMAASTGKDQLVVKRLPRIVILSSGDELVEVTETPAPHQIRRSNNYHIKAALSYYGINADMQHLPDNATIIKNSITTCIQLYDVLILSGGISMGRFDYIPQALEDCGVTQRFHKVQQRPGKPFWFGKHLNETLVFALPGNPVSTFMCLRRYFIPWLENSLGISQTKSFAMLDADFTFKPALQYFLQVKLRVDQYARLLATPVEGNGSGDYANLLSTDAFMELPLERDHFNKGECFEIWPFRNG